MTKFFDLVQNVFEYGLTLVFTMAAIGELTYSEPVADGFFGFLFSSPVVSVIYAVWFALMALTLLYAKWRRKKKIHKFALMSMYLTTLYTLGLTVFALGFVNIVDDIVIGLIAAFCWMRWKFKTEYINPAEFHEETWPLRDDTPDH